MDPTDGCEILEDLLEAVDQAKFRVAVVGLNRKASLEYLNRKASLEYLSRLMLELQAAETEYRSHREDCHL